MDYPLENLGPERFQELCQALLVKEKPSVQCFPVAQPDGGRDALSYISGEEPGKFIVYQVKYARHPLTDAEPRKWLLRVLQDEIPKVAGLIPRGAIQYYLITNVPGTAHLNRGAIDKLNRKISQDLALPFMCWWRDDINRRLDVAWDLKWVYPELMTGPDFLRAVLESGLQANRERQMTSIRAFLAHQFRLDEEVRFKQIELQNNLFDLFIDVPVALRDNDSDHAAFLHRMARRLSSRYRDSHHLRSRYFRSQFGRELDEAIGAAALLLGGTFQRRMPRVVLEGAPGQGKSTIAQFVCQVHRLKLLGDSVSQPVRLGEYETSPSRLPIKIDLRDFAAWLSRQDPFSPVKGAEPPLGWRKSLESFIAALISAQSGGTGFTADDLLAVCRICAVLIVFDGLDEVADVGIRSNVVEELINGLQRLEANSASLQTIITSRPAAFANSPGMPHDRFIHLQLVSLTMPLINEYAERWLRARRVPEREGNEFKEILETKLEQPHLRDLARSPMQLAILLSLILARGASLPDKRTALYENYLDVFLSREAEKSAIVREHRDLLIDIHQYLAWMLHSEAERGNPRASISQDRLKETVSRYLSEEGHDVGLADQLFAGVVERVFVLISRVQGTFEFEVQPLREYFAARYLYDTAPYSPPGAEKRGTKPDRFDAIARNFFWTNVTRFFAGFFSKGELATLAERLEVLALEDGFRSINHPRILAATLLADWVFSQNPRSVQRVMNLILDERGFRVLLASKQHQHPDPLVLPAKCGHEELMSACFATLKRQPAADFAFELMTVMRENAGQPGELLDLWLEGFDFTGIDKSQWLSYGVYLGTLARVDRARLNVTLENIPYDGRTIASLYYARRLEYLEDTEDHFERVIDAVLERSISGFAFRTEDKVASVIDVLAHAVELYHYRIALTEGGPAPLSELWARRGGWVAHSSDSSVSRCTEAFAGHAKCMALAEVVSREAMRPAAVWATEIEPWDSVVEVGRKMWGDRWAFLCLANTAAASRSQTEVPKGCAELLDSSTQLCNRIRYARLQANRKKWWAKQFESARDRRARRLVSLVALTWARQSTLVALQEPLDEALSSLSKTEWASVMLSADDAINLQKDGEDRRGDLRVSQIATGVSRRTIAAIAMRGTEKSAKRLLPRFRTVDRSRDLVPEVIWDATQDLERLGAPSWRPDLVAVRQFYSTGGVLPRVKLSRHSRGKGKQENQMPLPIAKEILEEATWYPSSLVALSEECCKNWVARQSKPVADIADAEGWFKD
jgi:hypothetical protein